MYQRGSRLALTLGLMLSSMQAEQGLSPAGREALQALARTYSIEIIAEAPSFPVKTIYGQINGSAARAAALDKYIPLLVDELTLYPPALIEKAELKRIVLCEGLSFADQVRNAVPDHVNDTLYLEVLRGQDSPRYLRKVIHHDFFHLVDLHDDGSMHLDEAWRALNGATYAYGDGGRNAQTIPTSSVLTEDYPGFLNYYSTTAVEEDKAEVFANLLVDPAYVEARTKKDKVLRSKVTRMRQLLTAFCPELDREFWRIVSKKKRSDE